MLSGMSIRLPALLIVLSLAGLLLASSSWRTLASLIATQDRPANDIAYEEAQTARLLGVPLQKFPVPQGLTGMDELPASAARFAFTLNPRPVSGPPPRADYKTRKIVKAVAPDGSIYEAYCGHEDDEPRQITPGLGFVSTFENRRQWYENLYGYGYMPQDVYIGKREAGLIKATLFFRDVGSHTTAPHTLAMDSHGMAHLAVADVNSSQDNRLDMYSVIGDPKSGRWTSAWLIDRRGFTSSSQPWSGAWRDKVHLIWDWCDRSYNKTAPGMGAYHVEWSASGFGRKTRIFTSPVSEVDAAVDPESGLLVIVVAKDGGGVYVLSRSADGKWTQPALLDPTLTKHNDVSISATGKGAFVIRTDSSWGEAELAKTKEWLLQPAG